MHDGNNNSITDARDLPPGYEPVAYCDEPEVDTICEEARANGKQVVILNEEGRFSVWRKEFRDWPFR